MKDSAVREILFSYQQKRDKAEYEFEERKKKIYNRFPEIQKIDDDITNVGLRMMRIVISNSPDKEIQLNQYKDKSYLERLISTNFFNLIVFNNSKENKVYRISNNIKNKLLLFLPNEPYNCHLPQINVDKLKSIFPAKLLWNK
mgnify:CR=1 FL=1